jgi:hypothetical protein
MVGMGVLVVCTIEKLMTLNLVWPYEGIPARSAESIVARPPTCSTRCSEAVVREQGPGWRLPQRYRWNTQVLRTCIGGGDGWTCVGGRCGERAGWRGAGISGCSGTCISQWMAGGASDLEVGSVQTCGVGSVQTPAPRDGWCGVGSVQTPASHDDDRGRLSTHSPTTTA